MPTIVGILTFMNMKNSIISLPEPKNAEFPVIYTYEHLKFYAQLVEHEKSFITSGPVYLS